MAEYIDKKGALDILRKAENANYGNLDVTRAINECIIDIMRLKVADVHPVRRGKWLHLNSGSFIFCSECEHEAYWDTDYGQQLFDYCPYSGARMDGDSDE